MNRPIDVYAHEGKSYFKVAKDAVFGTKSWIEDEPKDELQRLLNQRIRLVPGLLQWSPWAPRYVRELPFTSINSFSRDFNRFMHLTERGMQVLQMALVEHYVHMQDPNRDPTDDTDTECEPATLVVT